MKRSRLKTLLISLGAAAALSGLSACSPTQNATSSSSPTSSAMSDMNHGNMSHMGHMNLGPSDQNFDLRFIDAMTPHHQGAVEMAKEALQKSKRPEIKQLAQTIIKAQDQEIAEMAQWRKAWYAKATDTPMAWSTEMNHMMPMTKAQTNAMTMSMNLSAADEQFDLRFINAMIPHHEGAVEMANDALQKSKRPEIKTLARAIVSSQQAEIEQMKQWRKAWYNQ